MKKLIELLNEHRVELAHGNIQNQTMWHYNWYVFWFWDLNSQNCVLLIISKEYWFIKWLIDNDKVDRNFIDYAEIHETKRELESNYQPEDIERQYYEKLLMLLSIQDNPIEFLISVLK